MSSEKAQGKLHKLNLICKISSVSNVNASPSSKDQLKDAQKRAKGAVFARADGKKLILTNEQTKTDIIK